MGGGCLLLWVAAQAPHHYRRWLDTYLLTLLAGLVGARVGYVLLHPSDFQLNWLDSLRLWYGGLSWQGALLGAGLGLWLLLRWRRWVPAAAFLDGLALALPLLWMALWWACRGAGCGIGPQVDDPAAYPLWLVSYLPDRLGWVEPRYELQMLAILLGLLILLLGAGLTLRGAATERRFWLILLLLALLFVGLLPLIQERHYPWLDGLSALLLLLAALGGWGGSGKRGKAVVPPPWSDQV